MHTMNTLILQEFNHLKWQLMYLKYIPPLIVRKLHVFFCAFLTLDSQGKTTTLDFPHYEISGFSSLYESFDGLWSHRKMTRHEKSLNEFVSFDESIRELDWKISIYLQFYKDWFSRFTIEKPITRVISEERMELGFEFSSIMLVKNLEISTLWRITLQEHFSLQNLE